LEVPATGSTTEMVFAETATSKSGVTIAVKSPESPKVVARPTEPFQNAWLLDVKPLPWIETVTESVLLTSAHAGEMPDIEISAGSGRFVRVTIFAILGEAGGGTLLVAALFFLAA